MSVAKKILVWLDAMRWHQWEKGLWLFLVLVGRSEVPLIDLQKLLFGLILVTVISSGVYINNDIADREKDLAHPTKRNRAFASGVLTVQQGAVAILLLWLLAGLLLVYLGSINVALLSIAMVIGNLLYTRVFKHIAYVELAFYAFLFPLRYWIGAALVPSPYWVVQSLFVTLVAVFFLTLLRYSEKTRLEDSGRSVLKRYSARTLFWVMLLVAMGAIVSHYFVVAVLGLKAVFLTVIMGGMVVRYIVLAVTLAKDRGRFADLDVMFVSSKTLITGSLLYVVVALL